MTDLTTKAAEIRAGLGSAEQMASELRNAAAFEGLGTVYSVLDRAAALIEQQAAELAEKAGIYDEQVTRAEKQWQAWETRATTAESERDELLREKERLEAALRSLHDAASAFHNAALVHLSDTTFDSDGGLSEADAELSVNALPGARSALENGPAGLADARSEPPDPSSQSERIAVLEAAMREKDRVVHLYGKHDKMTDREKLGAIINHPCFAAALATLGEE